MYKVVRWPGSRKLHAALLQLQGCRRVLVLVALDGFVVNQMSDIKQHFAGVRPLAGNLFCKWQEHTVHLYGKSPRLRLALSLSTRTFTQAVEILLSDRHITQRITWASVIDENFKVHLGFTA